MKNVMLFLALLMVSRPAASAEPINLCLLMLSGVVPYFADKEGEWEKVISEDSQSFAQLSDVYQKKIDVELLKAGHTRIRRADQVKTTDAALLATTIQIVEGQGGEVYLKTDTNERASSCAVVKGIPYFFLRAPKGKLDEEDIRHELEHLVVHLVVKQYFVAHGKTDSEAHSFANGVLSTAAGSFFNERMARRSELLLSGSPLREESGEQLIHFMSYPFIAGPMKHYLGILRLADHFESQGRSRKNADMVATIVRQDVLEIAKDLIRHSAQARKRLAVYYLFRAQSTDAKAFERAMDRFERQDSGQLRTVIYDKKRRLSEVERLTIHHLLLSRPIESTHDLFDYSHIEYERQAELDTLADVMNEAFDLLDEEGFDQTQIP